MGMRVSSPANRCRKGFRTIGRGSWRRQAGEPRVRAREAAERIGPGGDDLQAALHVVAPVRGRRIALEQRLQAAGDRLDRPERIAQLVADDADQPLPRLTFLLAQRPADVRQHQQVMGKPAKTKGGAPHFPSPARAAGLGDIDDPRRLAEPVGHAQLLGGASQHLLDGAVHQPFARAVGDAQMLRRIEGEDGDVDLLHHRAEQRRGFDRTEALLVQRLGEGVHLGKGGAERVVGIDRAAADAEVVLAQRRQQVGEGLERHHDA